VGFHEINARQSDFAFVSAVAQIALDGEGRCTRAAIGIGAVSAVPFRLDAVAEELKGNRYDEGAVRKSLGAALEGIEAMADLHASAAYRKRVAATMAIRAIADAYQDAARRG
jgi:carbon-monoxide dehydrogenase medium subunit